MARFSKSAALSVLDARAAQIAREQSFERGRGTFQLQPRGTSIVTDALVDRCVQYGRMRAYEEFACAIEEGFRFDLPEQSK